MTIRLLLMALTSAGSALLHVKCCIANLKNCGDLVILGLDFNAELFFKAMVVAVRQPLPKCTAIWDFVRRLTPPTSLCCNKVQILHSLVFTTTIDYYVYAILTQLFIMCGHKFPSRTSKAYFTSMRINFHRIISYITHQVLRGYIWRMIVLSAAGKKETNSSV